MNGNGARINWRWVASIAFSVFTFALGAAWNGGAIWAVTTSWKDSVEQRFQHNDASHNELFSEIGEIKSAAQSNGVTLQQVFDRQTILIDIACAGSESTETIRLLCRRVQNGNSGTARGGMR